MVDTTISRGSQRPHQDSVSQGEENPLETTASLSLLEKRQKYSQDATATIHGTEALATQIRTAFDIRQAISETSSSVSIGYVVAKIPRQKQPSQERKTVLRQLQAIVEDFPGPYKFGTFKTGFHLRVTRPGCEFDGDVAPKSRSIENLLPDWLENAAISGYGDMKSLETKVDPSVRNAREIPASEFTVSSSFLETIRETWERAFIPKDVRVEPYKIHLYGYRGHFKSHRDTPEVGLVGTFLVGLGDTSATWVEDELSGHFCIGGHKLAAKPCSWVAFHPSVPHAVSTLDYGSRAVIAFKIFHNGGTIEEQELASHATIQTRLEAVLLTITPPFGILLEHMYHIGTSQLNGFDAVLFSAARQVHQATVHVLPVVIRSHSSVYYDESDEYENSYWSRVYPLTPAHVEYILSEGKNKEARAKTKWLHCVRDVPFYSWDLKGSTAEWERGEQQLNYTGNEADGERVTCVYVSHALLVLASDNLQDDSKSVDSSDEDSYCD